MKADNHSEKDIALGKTLRQWTVNAALPPRFQEQVWQRIAKAERRPEPFSWTVLWDWIQAVVPRPKFTYAYLAVLLVMGVAAGSVAAQIKTSRLESDLSARYVQSIDPYRADSARP